MSWLTWQVEGQQTMFDNIDYHQPGTELGWIPDELLNDDEAYELLGSTRQSIESPTWAPAAEGWSS